MSDPKRALAVLKTAAMARWEETKQAKGRQSPNRRWENPETDRSVLVLGEQVGKDVISHHFVRDKDKGFILDTPDLVTAVRATFKDGNARRRPHVMMSDGKYVVFTHKNVPKNWRHYKALGDAERELRPLLRLTPNLSDDEIAENTRAWGRHLVKLGMAELKRQRVEKVKEATRAKRLAVELKVEIKQGFGAW